jgi:hypothetical protein
MWQRASANRVAEEVYPTPWCWISFLWIESSTYNNANSILRYLRDGAMRSGWTDKIKTSTTCYKLIINAKLLFRDYFLKWNSLMLFAIVYTYNIVTSAVLQGLKKAKGKRVSYSTIQS